MRRHEFLRRLHDIYRPRTYFEIGVNTGRSLGLSRVPTVAVDPSFMITSDLRCDLQLVKATSDAFFARNDPLAHLRGARIDLAFIDGMHLFEFALRDFVNTERYMDWTSVVVFDDILPRTTKEAARRPRSGGWAGDVFKMIPVLQRYRPDLITLVVDTQPTGIMVVLGADARATALADRYDEIIHEYVVDDPQQVPDAVLHRQGVLDPLAVLGAPFWAELRAARDTGAALDRQRLSSVVEAALGPATPHLDGWRPEHGRSRRAVPTLNTGRLVARLARAVVGVSVLRRMGHSVMVRLPAAWQRTIRMRVHRAQMR